jgi:hypothetical protein
LTALLGEITLPECAERFNPEGSMAVALELTAKWQAVQTQTRDWWLNNPALHAAEICKSDIVANWLAIGDVSAKSVLDIGSGPFSMLQRRPVGRAVAVDPIDFGPLEDKYRELGIQRVIAKVEDLTPEAVGHFAEAWIYNCLAFTESPNAVLQAAMRLADRVRVFEWINIPAYEDRLHLILAENIVQQFHGSTWTDELITAGVTKLPEISGTFFTGVFAPRS